MSLFLKIFLWFWLAMALIVGAVTLVNWSTRTAPLQRQWRVFIGEAIKLNSQTAAQIYENQGLEGLKIYFNRQTSRRRINSIGFFNKNRELIAGNLKIEDINKLFDDAINSDDTQFKRFPDRTFGAIKVLLDDGETYVYILELRRFQPPPFFTTRRVLQILTVILIGGLFCYFLARYITLPIKKLRSATAKIAEGDFETKVAEKVGNRRDELAYLAKDFDEMAERIENLIESEKRLTQDISHELRSPLARMNVALELARVKSNPETLPLLERLDKESVRLNDLIGQLLTLSKLETGAQKFEKHEINLTNLIESIIADSNFEAVSEDKAVKVIQNDEAKVIGSEQLLRSAIENVVRNAVSYTKENTTVEVLMKADKENAIIMIKDFGEGVPEKELNKLFKPFYRVHEARDRKSGGTGLGLAIAEQAVENHKGKISARNSDSGLTVEIILPTLTS